MTDEQRLGPWTLHSCVGSLMSDSLQLPDGSWAQLFVDLERKKIIVFRDDKNIETERDSKLIEKLRAEDELHALCIYDQLVQRLTPKGK